MILGITGGTGCGKTTLLRQIQERGGLILDCDAVYHELLSRDMELLNAISDRFPGVVVEKKLERKKLGAIVFADPQALADLNAITHGAIKAEIVRRLSEKPPLAAIDAIGELPFVDFDTISITNLNRQIIALRSTVGKYKADVMRDRALDINPDAIIHSVKLRYCDDTREELLTPNYDFIIDAIDTVKMCLKVFTGMVATMTANTANMKLAAQKGFINATDLADYLVKKGMPFRSAYKISGQLVAKCIQEGTVLEDLPLAAYKQFSELFEEDLYNDINLLTCVEKRISQGGTSVASVEAQMKYVKERI